MVERGREGGRACACARVRVGVIARPLLVRSRGCEKGGAMAKWVQRAKRVQRSKRAKERTCY
eukprot:5738923-Pleurochrysis_carterae.AAC.1